MSRTRLTPLRLTPIIVLFVALPAWGQQQPFGGPTAPTQGQADDKKEGPAEAAPASKAGLLPTTRVLSQPKNRQKRLDVFSLDGYFRWRGDWFKNFDLGFIDDPDIGGAPFVDPLSCMNPTPTGKPCSDSESIKSSNLRLRLEPVIHLDEKSSVHMQIDVLDNLVLGSNPYGTPFDGSSRPSNIPIGAFTDGQSPAGQTLLVKRAWAEVATPVGLLKFGRMPWHWGLGISANSSAYDPVHDTYDLDGDYGDNVDRLSMAAQVPGTTLEASVAMDWVSTSPTSNQTGLFENRSRGQAWDLDDHDDVNQWVFTLSRMDAPGLIADKLADGEWVLNYGGFLAYKTQGWEQNNVTLGETPAEEDFVSRGMKIYQPDLWLRIAKGGLNLEFEATGNFGSIEDLADLGIANSVNVRTLGAVGRLDYKMMEGKLLLQAEVGYASGDQWDNSPEGRTHVSNSVVLPQTNDDDTISAFQFDLAYNIDLILFRELLGTVTNATYIRPRLRYDVNERFFFSGQSVLSLANVPVATPGNSNFYGLEFDADVGYHNDGYFMGVAYGVLFPMGAMDHPEDSAFSYGSAVTANGGDAKTAQTIQFRLGLQF